MRTCDESTRWNEAVRTLVLGVAAGCLLFDGLADRTPATWARAARLALGASVVAVAAARRRD